MDYISPNNNNDASTKEMAFGRNPWLVSYFLVLFGVLVFGSTVAIKFSKKSEVIQQIDIAIADQNVLQQVASAPGIAPVSSVAPVSTVAPVPSVASVDNKQVVLAVAELKEVPKDVPKTLIFTVRSKDNLGRILKRSGLDVKIAASVLKFKQARVLKGLHAGKKISLTLDPTKTKLQELTYEINDLDTLIVTAKNDIWHVKTKHIEPTVNTKYASATIKGSIYTAGKNAGVPSKLMPQLVSAFSNKVNVNKLRSGDSFALFYKEHTVNGKKIGDNQIAAAELRHDGQLHRVIGFTDPHGRTNFYTPDGHSVEPSFIRYPVTNFKYIGSRFSVARHHPLLDIIRAHRGVDFTADRGTPVRATCNGRVTYVGRHGGHGKTIIMERGPYTTLFAHLSKYSDVIFPGKHVKRGDVIGYVGSSGLATGPHLHYEFHINGVPHDPLKVKLPAGEMIAAEYRGRFFAQSKKLVAQLELHRKNHRMFAMNSQPDIK